MPLHPANETCARPRLSSRHAQGTREGEPLRRQVTLINFNDDLTQSFEVGSGQRGTQNSASPATCNEGPVTDMG